jgi:ketosteroid isomerase-like protein
VSRQRALAVLLLLLLGAGCVFERRPDPDVLLLDAEREAEADLLPEPPRELPEAAAATVAEVFREAVRLGDLSLALGLLHREAVLLDGLATGSAEGVAGPATRGELLLAMRRLHQDGLRLLPTEVDVAVMDDVAVVTTHLDLLRPLEEGEELAVQEARVWETLVLVATPEGWRIRHLHRSLRPLD